MDTTKNENICVYQRSSTSPQQKLAELKELLTHQQEAQQALADKIVELEQML